MKKMWLVGGAGLLVIILTISYLNTPEAEEVLEESSENEEFADSESYNIFEETGNSKVVFVYSDPTEHHPQG